MTAFIKWLISLWQPQHFTGLPYPADPRTPEDQQKDYAHEERVFPQAKDPFGNSPITDSPFKPYYNQVGTSSCVPHGVGLALAIERKADVGVWARLSPLFAYRLRSNYPQEGSYPPNIFDMYAKYGAPLLDSLPEVNTEAQANGVVLTAQMYTEAEIFKGKEFYTLQTFNDIAALANIAAAGHGVAILIYATYKEWAQAVPQILTPGLVLDATTPIRHCVCILPNSGFIRDGKRYVTIQDSSPFGGFYLRDVSEDFIAARCYGAGYWDTVETIGSGPRPQYTFTKTLKYGSKGPEVVAMQKLLIAEGVLPADCATGNFYGRTLAGVRAFQNKYADKILVPLGLDAPTNTWGSMCIAQANALCRG